MRAITFYIRFVLDRWKLQSTAFLIHRFHFLPPWDGFTMRERSERIIRRLAEIRVGQESLSRWALNSPFEDTRIGAAAKLASLAQEKDDLTKTLEKYTTKSRICQFMNQTYTREKQNKHWFDKY